MKKIINLLLVGGMALTLSGCYTTGLSLREKGSFNYSNFIYGLYGDDAGASREAKKITKPIKLAVAQVGENAPQQSVIDRLQKEGALISKVITLPLGNESETSGYYQNNNQKFDVAEFQKKMKGVRSLARDVGADFIFLFGGSADGGSTPSFWQVFDITIIGAYIIPSTKHEMEGRASGALIDVETGRVVFVTEAESKVSKFTPSYLNYYDANTQVFKEMRDDLVKKLMEGFVQKLEEVRGRDVLPPSSPNGSIGNPA